MNDCFFDKGLDFSFQIQQSKINKAMSKLSLLMLIVALITLIATIANICLSLNPYDGLNSYPVSCCMSANGNGR